MTIRETVPDSFLKRADHLVTLDLSVEDLLERLHAGKIDPAERVPWALEHFFKERNLATLRELALREVAESLDRDERRRRDGTPAAPGESAAVSGRVMVCLSSPPTRASALLRRGSRLAGRLNTDWFVVYVETPREAPHLDRRRGAAPPAGQRRDRARAGGRGRARQGRRSGAGAAGLRALARRRADHRRTLARPLVAPCPGRSVATRLIDEAAGFDVTVAALEEDR